MGFILIGLALGAIIIFILLKFGESFEDCAIVPAFILLVISLPILAIIVGITVPVKGYGEPVLISEVPLVSLSNSTVAEGKECIYVNITGDNTYSYRVEIDSKFARENEKSYEVRTIKNYNVTEVETDEVEKAVLMIYESKGIKSFWSFALNKKIDYVFYIPKGSISSEVTLK